MKTRKAGLRLQTVTAGLLLVGLSGCPREYWRKQADADAHQMISEKMTDPRWLLPRFDVTADPDSRFFDPYDADRPPLPPDDPAANVYMHCAGGIAGSETWHTLGESFSVENPQWLAKYGLTPEMMNPTTGDYTGRLPSLQKLKLSDCIELSQIHSRELQTQIEDLYLAALSLSFERFRFGVRYLGTSGNPSANFSETYTPYRDAGGTNLDGKLGMSRLLPAGGQIISELANTSVWSLTGTNTATSASSLSFILTQPLMNGRGKTVVLEKLTQEERDLLYAARDLARFRQLLFTDIVSEGTGSYLNLIQQIQVIRNQEQNIDRLRLQVAQLQSNSGQKANIVSADLNEELVGLVIPAELTPMLSYSDERKQLLWMGALSPEQEPALLKLAEDLVPGENRTEESITAFRHAVKELVQAIRVTPTPLDVLQLQGSLATSINQLRSQERTLQDGLDALKLNLGLPPDLVLSIDDSLLKPFTVIDPRLKPLENEVTDYVRVWAEIDENDPKTASLLATNQSFLELLQRIETEGFPILEEDLKNLNAKLDGRLAGLETEEDRLRVKSDIERDVRLFDDAKARLRELKQEALDRVALIQSPEAREVPPAAPGAEELPQEQLARQILSESILQGQQQLLQVTRSLSVVEIGLRVEQIEIPKFDLPMEYVLQTAVENRVDLMNEKATVMDARRQMEIAANDLQAVLDLNVSGELGTKSNQPLNFSREQIDLKAGVKFVAPIDKISERNTYRTSQINYQRARRNYMASEDVVKQEVRRSWRQLSVLKRNLETSRLQLRLAARQYESAVDESTAPAPATGGAGGGRTGVQGTNLIQALNSVVSAQNSLIQNWVSYEQNRLSIFRDIGMMEIGPDGVWNDVQYRESMNGDTSDEVSGQLILPDMGPSDGKE